MKHFGDITKLNGAELPFVDVITGGSPCQDLSVAGKRAGLDGARSGLFMEQIRLVKEMREHDRATRGTDVDIRGLRPRYMVWENVPGAFSSNKGKDFQAVLTEIARIVCKDCPDVPLPEKGKWAKSGCLMGYGDDGQPFSIAYRLHDAQFWGVPQRRKRIALVADFGGTSAPEILFESESVSGNLEQSREKGEGAATGTQGSINPSSYTLKIRGGVDVDSHGKKAGKGPLVQTELSGTLGVSQDQTLITKANVNCLNSWDVQSKHIQPEDGKAETLYSGECRYGGGESYVMQNKVYGISSYDSNAMKSPNPHSGIYEADTSRTLDLNGGSPACNQGGMIVLEGNGSRESHKGDGFTESDVMYTLNTVEHHGIVDTYQKTTGSLCASGYDKLGTQEAANDMYVVQSCSWDGSQVSPTLTKNNAGGEQRMPDKDNFNAVVQSMEVFHCTSEEDKAQTLKARDYKDPQIVAYGVDCYNQTQTEEVSKALNSAATDSDHVPCVYGVNSEVCAAESPIAFQGQAGAEASLQVGEDVSPTLLSGKNAMVSYGLDRASFNQGKNALYDFSVEEEKAQTLVSRGPGGVLAKQ